MKDSKIAMSVFKTTIYVLEEFSSSPNDYKWAWGGVAEESMEILTLYTYVLSTLYIVEHCVNHLLTSYSKMFGWSRAMTRHLHHLQRQFWLLPRRMIMGSMCCLTIRYCNFLSAKICFTIIRLVPAIRVHGWLLSWLCCCFQILQWRGILCQLLQQATLVAIPVCLHTRANGLG